MGDFRAPANIKIAVQWESYSSGLRHITLEGDSLGVVAALRAIVEQEGAGCPHEWRESVALCDSGQAHGSVYAVDSKQLPIRGRQVTAQEAARFGRAVLVGLGVTIRGEDQG